MKSTKLWSEGEIVKATKTITEGGSPFVGDPEAKFPNSSYIHALAGEEGVIKYVDDQGFPTVYFERTGTGTVVGDEEIEPSLGGDVKLLYLDPLHKAVELDEAAQQELLSKAVEMHRRNGSKFSTMRTGDTMIIISQDEEDLNEYRVYVTKVLRYGDIRIWNGQPHAERSA